MTSVRRELAQPDATVETVLEAVESAFGQVFDLDVLPAPADLVESPAR
jgi:hypothetical protein